MAKEGDQLIDVVREAGLGKPDIGPWPAIVESYDAAAGTVKVTPTPLIRDRTTGVTLDLGPLVVPVLWMGAGSIVFDFALSEGDEVLLIPTGPSIRAWLQVGGVQPGTGPGGRLGESVAIPVRLSSARRPGSSDGLARLGRDDGTATVVITMTGAGEVRIQSPSVVLGAEGSPQLAVARDTDPVNTNAALTTWRTAVEAGVLAAGGGVVPPLVGSAIGTVAATSTEVSSG